MVSLRLRIIREKNRMYSALLKLFSVLTPNAPKVFLFHDILEDQSQVKSKFAISQKSFETFLTNQLNHGMKPLNSNELSRVILNNEKQKKAFFVSFDDANESVFTKAYPFLKKNNIPFMLFITKELVGKPNFLNENQIKLLSQDELCTVGSHGMHHKMFRYYSEKEVAQELSASKTYLENLTGKSVECFAFPYGRVVECSRKNIQMLKRSEYKFAFSALAGNLGEKRISGRFFLPRVNVSENMVKY